MLVFSHGRGKAGGGKGAYSFVARDKHLKTDHASLQCRDGARTHLLLALVI